MPNARNASLPFNGFLIPASTTVHEYLAITRDADLSKTGIVHYTVAPKDAMTLGLYLVRLNALGKNAAAAG